MTKEKRDKRYSLPLRLLGAICTMMFFMSICMMFVTGVSFMYGFVAATAMAGLVGPSVATGESLLEMVSGVFELVIEGIQTIFEFVAELFSSIFG